MSLSISPANTNDGEAVASIYAASWPTSAEHIAILAVQKSLLEMRGVDFWDDEIRRQQDCDGEFIIARHDHRVVGFAGSTNEPHGCWELVWLFVVPEAVGLGIGRGLYEAIIAHSLDAQPSERLLWAIPGNHRAERFYANRGWRPTTSTKDVETSAGKFPLRKWVLPSTE